MANIDRKIVGENAFLECKTVNTFGATLDLPIDKNLGYAWVVPYKKKATFQLGYKDISNWHLEQLNINL